MTQQAPCVYPTCDDGSPGEYRSPRLTYNTICGSCRTRYARLLGWLVQDYVTLRTFPTLVHASNDGSKRVSPKAKSFGHPREEASDAAADLAQRLNWLEDDLRELNGDPPPAHPRTAEAHLVTSAYRYLTTHFDALCTHPAAADVAEHLLDHHARLRSLLGQTRLVQKLPAPCPTCDVAALTRSVGSIDCGNCGRHIDEDEYPFLTLIMLDRMIDAYDTRRDVAESSVTV